MASGDDAEPDALLLAAYAEGRLDETAAEPVERWLAAHPDAIADLAAARTVGDPLADAPAGVVARAMGLVAAAQDGVVPFRPRRAPLWRTAVAWSSLAASIAVTSLVGFELGSDAYLSYAGGQSASGFDLLDPPGGLFTSFAEDPST